MRSKRFIGYGAGIVSGLAYGLNPLFAKPLLAEGMSVLSMLFFRYLFAVLILGLYISYKRIGFKLEKKQGVNLAILGLLYTGSSAFLFLAYKFIPSGLATTLVYLYPVFTALIMLFLKQYPSKEVWISIGISLVGVCILCIPKSGEELNFLGISLSILSGLCFSLYMIIVNRAKNLQKLSSNLITFYALGFGAILFFIYHLLVGDSFWQGFHGFSSFSRLIMLALIPTVLSLVCLSIASKSIGPGKTAVLGVCEPICAILVGYALLKESINLNISIGVILCIIAVLYMILSTQKGSHSKIKIRPANQNDTDIVAWSILAALDIEDSKENLSLALKLASEKQSLYYWRRCIVAEVDGKNIGCIISYPTDNYKEYSSYSFDIIYQYIGKDFRNDPAECEENEYYIDSVAIKQEYRSLGLGKDLMNMAISRAEAIGKNKVSLLANCKKIRLIEYYKAMGFKEDKKLHLFGDDFLRMIYPFN